jgi:broad specificity phosphatase PhoE
VDYPLGGLILLKTESDSRNPNLLRAEIAGTRGIPWCALRKLVGVVASQVHLVRHGEVHNPSGVLYGRLPGFHLSELGREFARLAAADLAARKRPMTALAASPLQRAQESAAPISELLGLDIRTEARIIEPTNHFEGTVMSRALRNPLNWPWLALPWRPSWGEAYKSIASRMLAAVNDAFDTTVEGDAVLVSHQLPIWVTHLAVAGESFMHDPRQRRCNLSSITSFERRDGRLVEVGYTDPAAALSAGATDVGAV